MKRITKIFDRAVSVFKDDVSLWKDYIGFALRAKRFQSLGKIIARGLLFHARNRDLWLIAFNTEKLIKNNWDSSREVLQKAVKFLPKDKEIWLEYLRFEKEYAERSEVEKIKNGQVLRIALKHA